MRSVTWTELRREPARLSPLRTTYARALKYVEILTHKSVWYSIYATGQSSDSRRAEMKPKRPNNRESQYSPGPKNSAEPKRKVRVVIADENTLCRKGLGELLREDGRFDVLAEVAHGEAALKAVRDQKPEVAVLDAGLPGISGLDVAALLE